MGKLIASDSDGAHELKTVVSSTRRWFKRLACSLTLVILGFLVGSWAWIGRQGWWVPLPPEACPKDKAQWPVFRQGDAGASCFRIPAIVRTASSSLLAFAEARHGALPPPGHTDALMGCEDSSAQEIAMRRSEDGGKTWSDVVFAAGSRTNHVGNPYPIALQSGRVVLIYVKHQAGCTGDCGHQTAGNGMVYSDDDGKTWSEEQDVTRDFGDAGGCMPGPGAGVQLDNGRLLVVSHCGPYTVDYITYSDDDGGSWKTVPDGFRFMDEATLTHLGGNKVIVNMRHLLEGVFGRAISRSYDGGLTWESISFDRALLGPVCEGSLAQIGNKTYFANPSRYNSRSRIVVKSSADGGVTWPNERLVTGAATWGYTSLVQGVPGAPGGHAGVLFEASGRGQPSEIRYCAFSKVDDEGGFFGGGDNDDDNRGEAR